MPIWTAWLENALPHPSPTAVELRSPGMNLTPLLRGLMPLLNRSFLQRCRSYGAGFDQQLTKFLSLIQRQCTPALSPRRGCAAMALNVGIISSAFVALSNAAKTIDRSGGCITLPLLGERAGVTENHLSSTTMKRCALSEAGRAVRIQLQTGHVMGRRLQTRCA